MGDMFGAVPPKKEPQPQEKPLSGQKKTKSQTISQNQKQKQMPAKSKRGSVLSAIEDIQRMSPEAICQEFDRLVVHTERHFERDMKLPCSNVADQLMRCLRQHHQQSFKCFKVMDDYRECVGLATQDHVDEMALQDEQDPPPPLPMTPPKSVSLPATPEKMRNKRSWLKPWTWLR